MKKTLISETVIVLSIFLSLAVILISYAGTNHAPVVSNVSVQQRQGTRLIDITYNVEDADGDLLEITVQVSIDDGKTYSITPKYLTGDAGRNIEPG